MVRDGPAEREESFPFGDRVVANVERVGIREGVLVRAVKEEFDLPFRAEFKRAERHGQIRLAVKRDELGVNEPDFCEAGRDEG